MDSPDYESLPYFMKIGQKGPKTEWQYWMSSKDRTVREAGTTPTPALVFQLSCPHHLGWLNTDNTSSWLPAQNLCLIINNQFTWRGVWGSTFWDTVPPQRHQRAARDRAGSEISAEKPGLLLGLPLPRNQKMTLSVLTLYFSLEPGWIFGGELRKVKMNKNPGREIN